MSVRATTVLTHVTASAPILLFIEENGACNTTYNQPPLLILERYEEEEHLNLVPLNRTKHPLCNYVLTNRWPIDQNWLYVDDEGLHTKSIDREDVSIAFMPVSQIQVELNLHCGSDLRMKRSLSTNGEQNWLGPYDYGANKWILTDSISYNARRTLVNLIVKDINDNSPIFVGLENEPIVVGYPESDIEGFVSPRFLVKVEATDADIGENAAIMYWSTDPRVVVSPNTGDVHVHNTATIEDNYRFTVNATDRRGSGNTGSIDVLVKLLSSEEIVVITVQNSFLDDEDQVLSALNAAVDYDIKMLCASVVTGNIEPTYKRQQSDDLGVSLRLFVYGIKSQEAIKVDRLTSDLSDSNIVTVNIASVLSLQDHLDKLQICPLPGRDTGLLVATIVLAGVVLIITLTVAVCFFLKRKKEHHYDQFSDRNSLASRNDSIKSSKSEILPKINLDELRKSEKKLQERLDAANGSSIAANDMLPVIIEEPSKMTDVAQTPKETLINISAPDPKAPIVIQSIDKLKDSGADSDDDDEFGEKNKVRRKSVVTFNENVEKIIHLEDGLDEESSEPDIEVYKF
ncbi:uncharacterized protein LOC126977109 [Leptidea sinapis]|uniref:uncharacterized protein LOC126977109 n=1 Tax=Leptidea sinapis TaxID=189913 RepID=UPI002129518C|nr:uncharacterized protein LOC126977109 [Leptidea sinapis]